MYTLFIIRNTSDTQEFLDIQNSLLSGGLFETSVNISNKAPMGAWMTDGISLRVASSNPVCDNKD